MQYLTALLNYVAQVSKIKVLHITQQRKWNLVLLSILSTQHYRDIEEEIENAMASKFWKDLLQLKPNQLPITNLVTQEMDGKSNM